MVFGGGQYLVFYSKSVVHFSGSNNIIKTLSTIYFPQSASPQVYGGVVLPRRALVPALPAGRGDLRRRASGRAHGAQARLVARAHDTHEVMR